jgi:hypothetical protein
MLAYVFWHRRAPQREPAEYEARLRAFHERIGVPSAAFRLDRLPFAGGGPGYEDWYLVDSWAALGELNARAVDARRRAFHDAVAGMAGEGWGGVYALARGDPSPPTAVRWLDKPRGVAYETFLAGLRSPSVWLRQLVLGPAPEVCAAGERYAASAGRLAL